LILTTLIVIRFLVGGTHAPLFPVIGGTIGNWFPVSGWALPNGLTSGALNLGAAAAVPLIVWLMNISGWRGSFFLTAPLGFLAAFLWWHYVRDYPALHTGVSKNELELIDADRPPPSARERGAWKLVIKDRNVLLLTLSYFCMNYFFYLVFNWFFIYLVDIRHVPEQEAGILTASQYIVGSVGATLGGYACDRLAKRFGPRWGYRMLPIPGLILSAVILVAGAMVKNSYAAVALLALCSGLTQLTDPVYWGAIVSVAGRHASSASGILNTGGNAVGGIGAILVPLIAKYFGWTIAISSGAIFLLAAAFLWLLIKSDEPMVGPPPKPSLEPGA
jgi:MFS transporter, ACS family, glucarate transporter